MARKEAKLRLHLQDWLHKSSKLPCAAISDQQSAISNRQSAISNQQSAIGNRQSAIGSRSWRAEDGRGHKAGSSFRFGDFD
ncbi:MAG: hypothetical protein DWI29_02240, partial [Planctomycetota bacterium]